MLAMLCMGKSYKEIASKTGYDLTTIGSYRYLLNRGSTFCLECGKKVEGPWGGERVCSRCSTFHLGLDGCECGISHVICSTCADV